MRRKQTQFPAQSKYVAINRFREIHFLIKSIQFLSLPGIRVKRIIFIESRIRDAICRRATLARGYRLPERKRYLRRSLDPPPRGAPRRDPDLDSRPQLEEGRWPTLGWKARLPLYCQTGPSAEAFSAAFATGEFQSLILYNRTRGETFSTGGDGRGKADKTSRPF